MRVKHPFWLSKKYLQFGFNFNLTDKEMPPPTDLLLQIGAVLVALFCLDLVIRRITMARSRGCAPTDPPQLGLLDWVPWVTQATPFALHDIWYHMPFMCGGRQGSQGVFLQHFQQCPYPPMKVKLALFEVEGEALSGSLSGEGLSCVTTMALMVHVAFHCQHVCCCPRLPRLDHGVP